MNKVGLVWVGHPDYVGDNSSAIQRAIVGSLNGIENLKADLRPIATNEKEAVAQVREVLADGCCGAVIILATWVECNVVMSALKELYGRPCMFWGFPVEEVENRKESTGSYVSATMFAGVVKRIGLRSHVLYTSWKNDKTLKKIEAFAAAAVAKDALNYAKIGLVGYTSMSIYTGTFDHVMMRNCIGPEIEQMDSYTLINEAEASTDDEIREAEKRLKGLSRCEAGMDQAVLDRTMGIYVALKKFCEKKEWDAVNVKCQYEFSKEYMTVPCVSLSLLAEDNILSSCEGDIPVTVSMLMLKYLTDDIVWYGDSLTHWDNTLQFSPCGFMPFSLAKGTADVISFKDNEGFNGLQVKGVLRPEKVTWMRLVEDIGSYHIIYGTGQGIDTEPRGGNMPALNVVLDGDINRLIEEYSGQHFAVAYGDVSDKIEMLAYIMGIEARRI